MDVYSEKITCHSNQTQLPLCDPSLREIDNAQLEVELEESELCEHERSELVSTVENAISPEQLENERKILSSQAQQPVRRKRRDPVATSNPEEVVNYQLTRNRIPRKRDSSTCMDSPT